MHQDQPVFVIYFFVVLYNVYSEEPPNEDLPTMKYLFGIFVLFFFLHSFNQNIFFYCFQEKEEFWTFNVFNCMFFLANNYGNNMRAKIILGTLMDVISASYYEILKKFYCQSVGGHKNLMLYYMHQTLWMFIKQLAAYYLT